MFRSLLVFLLLALGFIGGASGIVRAGTTGSISGTIVDAKTNRPVAGVVVQVASPSQTAKTTTDASGKFTFISLAPDTYVVSAEKNGYEAAAQSGVSVFADQLQTLDFRLQPALRTIGHVTTRSALDLVKPGTTTDVYSLDAATTAAAAPAGGGGSLNSAYSALAVLPGAFVPPNQMGVNQTVYIRGGNYDQIGYEYDGVPVNRSFDNYPGHAAATLGQQELQVYTGGGGPDQTATGLSGFINQVVKTGSYPGFTNVATRLGGPTFDHEISAETGGATTNGLFRYYVGLTGYNQDFRYFDNFNGASFIDEFPNTGPSNQTTYLPHYPAVYPTCNSKLRSPFDNGQITPPNFYSDPGCYAAMNPAYSDISMIEGRDSVANLHFGIPHHHDGGTDDIQLLYTNSTQFRQYYSGVEDTGYTPGELKYATGHLPEWPDYITYPAGTQFFQAPTVNPIAYYFPGSTQQCANTDIKVANTCPPGTVSELPADYRDGRIDTASIMKAQYQKNLGTKAYVRLFGYLFYSDTNRSGAAGKGIGSGFSSENYDYEIDSHTRGAELQFGDQLSDQHILTGTLNYVTATTDRLNNYDDYNFGDTATTNLTNGSECFAARTGYSRVDNQGNLPKSEIPYYVAGQPAPCNDPITQGTFKSPTDGLPLTCAQGLGVLLPDPAACSLGASWHITYTGNQGLSNTVRPQFAGVSLNDGWHPSSRWSVNTGIRFERDEYDLANTNTPGKNFWYNAAQNEFCYNPVTLQPVFIPQPPQYESFQVPYVGFNCPIDDSTGKPVQTVHPNGLQGNVLLSNVYNPTLVQTYPEPRVGATYEMDPNTVLRFNAGRYVQQPQAYEVQYNSVEENLASELIGFLPYGFDTPRHDSLPQYSNNFDASLEHRFRNTDLSVKLTPYFRYATNQLYTVSVYGASPALNTGVERSDGIELELTKGNFARNGFSMLLSYTYLDSKERWDNYPGTNNNPVDVYNQYIQEYNALTRAGGGAACYGPQGIGVPRPTCGPNTILNPYYNSAPQPLFNRNGWYDTGLDYPYTSPNVFAAILSYRHDKFAIAPVMTLNEGATYGNPGDVIGLDPRTCFSNSANSGIKAPNPLQADYTSCGFAATPSGNLYIPNPETGHFDGFGEFRQPWQFNLGLQMSYQIAPRVTVNAIATNLVNQCFGGSSTPWSRAYAPSSVVCAYQANPFYIANFYNGSSPNDVAANGVPLNPYFAHSYVPSYGDVNTYNVVEPMNVYVTLSVRL